MHGPTSALREGPVKFEPPSKALHRGSWASVVSATTDSTTSSEGVLQCALGEQIVFLQGCLVRVMSFLEWAEAAVSRLSPVSAMLQTALTSCPPIAVGVCSEEDTEAKLYGCFSPRVGDISSSMSASSSVLSTTQDESIAMFVAPVLQVMPEIREKCLNSASLLSVKHMEVDSLVTSCEGVDSCVSCERSEASCESFGSKVHVVEVIDVVGVCANGKAPVVS
ncbi:hypothetical protein D1007_09391 [Hordeum vulgare]|nr:hypothetical protein D1007_09391 [Hordeum vulgare]